MLTDKHLIRGILKKGSNKDADELVRRYYDDLFYYIYRQVGNREDSLDLTQEVFIASLNGLSSYNPKKASFRTWLFRIATYKVIDFRRKKRVVWLTLEEDEWDEREDLVESLHRRELLLEISEYVLNFQPEIQEIFQLRIYGNSSFPEIALILDQKEEKIKAQYYRLIKKVREEFGNDV